MLYSGVMWPPPASGLTHQRLCDAAATGAAAPRLESFHCAGARQHHARGRSAVPAAQLLFVAALIRPLPSSRPPDPILSLFRREQDPLLPAVTPLRHVLWQGPHQERPRLLALQRQRRHNRDGLRPQRPSMLFTRCHSTRLMSCGKMLRDMSHSTRHTSQVQVMMGLQQQVQMKCAACSGTGVEGAQVQLTEPYTPLYAPLQP